MKKTLCLFPKDETTEFLRPIYDELCKRDTIIGFDNDAIDDDEYFEKLDFTLLTSISEGQPLSVLESFAARRPAVTTDVGCCSELLNGKPGDTLGKAGYFAPPMQREKLADAMEHLCESSELRRKMGDIGQKRTYEYYRYEIMLTKYRNLYKEVEKEWPGLVLN